MKSVVVNKARYAKWVALGKAGYASGCAAAPCLNAAVMAAAAACGDRLSVMKGWLDGWNTACAAKLAAA